MRVYATVHKNLAARARPLRWLARRCFEAAGRRRAGARLSWGERLLWGIGNRLILAKVRRRLGGRLTYAISGAAALPREVAEFVDDLGVAVYEGYGLTETSPVVAANVPGHRKIGSVGRPLPGVDVVIDRSATGDPRDGEIVVSGPNVMRGYHERGEETAAVLAKTGAFRTGDVGYLDDDGYLFITGRIKEQYKLANGKYVSPAPLEERLKLSPFIADVMIHGDGRLYNVALLVPDDEEVCGWIVEEGLAGPTAASAYRRDPSLFAKVAEHVAGEIARLSVPFRGYERIGAFTLLPEGFTQENYMLTPSMKLKRRHIVARWRDEIDRLYREDADAAAAAGGSAAHLPRPSVGGGLEARPDR